MATEKQKKAMMNVVENGGNVSKAMRDAGYSAATAKTPQKLTQSDAWQELMGKALSDVDLADKHRALLDSHRLDHMTFPLGPVEDEEDDDVDLYVDETKDLQLAERTTLTDKDIKQLLADVGCTVRRIVHGQTARHVYFWSPDNRARKDALEMAYKLKGRFAATKVALVDPYEELDDEALFDELAKRGANGGASKDTEAQA